MEPLQGAFLGVIQGLTEFLPVSSSGHLVLFQQLFGLHEAELFFDISVHIGTLFAVIVFFRKEIWEILASLITNASALAGGKTTFSDVCQNPNVRIAFLIIIGSIPTGIIGLAFHSIKDQLFSSAILVGIALIFNGIVLWLTQSVKPADKDIAEFSFRHALIIGVAQGLAIIPGISRSGSTIATGLFLGLRREIATRYSFLLSIPAIVGAELLSIKDIGHEAAFEAPVILGTLASATVGYGALVLLVYMVRKGQLHQFAPYCWLVGVLTLMSGWVHLLLEW